MTDLDKMTRKALVELYRTEHETRDRMQAQRDEARGNLATAEKRNKELAEQFADLKQRLHAAETANQFMRGYLARVQEDDVVREELIATGDPAGETHMVPKRKPTVFERPNDFTTPSPEGRFPSYIDSIRDRDRKPRHWITY